MRIPLSMFPSATRIPVMIILLLITVSLSPCHLSAAKTDTTYAVVFQLNMTKAVRDHLFNPDADYVYVVMDQGISPLRMVPGPNYNYSFILDNGLDSGVTYHFKFRINEASWEIVNRTVTARPGTVNINAWWNNEALNYTRFMVNMFYAGQSGLFHPETDSVCIVGTMNNMQGSPAMHRIDTSLSYFIIYTLDPGSVQEYKFRINADSSGLELMHKPQRIIRIPDTLMEVAADFNNYNPAKRLMTFRCDMGYYVRARHFDPENDYMDVAGNFNMWGANDAMFDRTGDTLYSLEKYMDTTWFHTGPLLFKFRINGSWETAELEGKPDRSYVFHDTINGNLNIFSCYYNNLDPRIPTPPWAYDLSIQGDLINHQVISGSYTYENVNGIPEASSLYQWYRSNDAQGASRIPIDSAWHITYTIDTLDIGKWLVFEITPKAASGDSATGKPVQVVSVTPIGGVGINELSLISRVYPNPASAFIIVETGQPLEWIEIIHPSGKIVMMIDQSGEQSVRIPVGTLPRGIYFLRALSKEGKAGSVKFIRQ